MLFEVVKFFVGKCAEVEAFKIVVGNVAIF
jgi:hypothetical protein